jgi:hypothetical protein
MTAQIRRFTRTRSRNERSTPFAETFEDLLLIDSKSLPKRHLEFN